jgi:hypothetical protein
MTILPVRMRGAVRAAVVAAALAVVVGSAGITAPTAHALPQDNANESGRGCWRLGRYYSPGEKIYRGGTVYECRDGRFVYVGVLALVPSGSVSLLEAPVR